MKVKVNGSWVDVPAFKVAEKSPLEEYLAEVNAMMADNCLWIERDSADNEVQWYENTTLCSSETDSDGAWVGKTTIKKYYTSKVKVRFGQGSSLAGNKHITAIHSLPHLFLDEPQMQGVNFIQLAVESLPPFFGLGVGVTTYGFKEIQQLKEFTFGGVITNGYQWCMNNVAMTKCDLSCAITLVNIDNTWYNGCTSLTELILGIHFFDARDYQTHNFARVTAWSAESIYDSLYTRQEGRNTDNTHITIQLATTAYNRLSAQQIADINSRGFTLTK